jgi:UDP-GlcNAc3NAcA epimerase
LSRILTVIGARPQFIKAAAVSRALVDIGVAEDLLHTGQHYDVNMSESFFAELEIPTPRYNLGVGSGRHGEQTARMLSAIEEILVQDAPDIVLVYGDTNSTLAGALAAAKLHIPVAHVEAGLRSFNRRMPEELNRVLTDQLAELLFAPTASAVANLRSEGISADRIHRTGDVMYDVALRFREKAHAASHILRNTRTSPGGYILATVHRAENTDDGDRLQPFSARSARSRKRCRSCFRFIRARFPVSGAARAS